MNDVLPLLCSQHKGELKDQLKTMRAKLLREDGQLESANITETPTDSGSRVDGGCVVPVERAR